MAQDEELDLANTLVHYHHMVRHNAHILDRIKVIEQTQKSIQSSVQAVGKAPSLSEVRQEIQAMIQAALSDYTLEKDNKAVMKALEQQVDQLQSSLTSVRTTVAAHEKNQKRELPVDPRFEQALEGLESLKVAYDASIKQMSELEQRVRSSADENQALKSRVDTLIQRPMQSLYDGEDAMLLSSQYAYAQQPEEVELLEHMMDDFQETQPVPRQDPTLSSYLPEHQTESSVLLRAITAEVPQGMTPVGLAKATQNVTQLVELSDLGTTQDVPPLSAAIGQPSSHQSEPDSGANRDIIQKTSEPKALVQDPTVLQDVSPVRQMSLRSGRAITKPYFGQSQASSKRAKVEIATQLVATTRPPTKRSAKGKALTLAGPESQAGQIIKPPQTSASASKRSTANKSGTKKRRTISAKKAAADTTVSSLHPKQSNIDTQVIATEASPAKRTREDSSTESTLTKRQRTMESASATLGNSSNSEVEPHRVTLPEVSGSRITPSETLLARDSGEEATKSSPDGLALKQAMIAPTKGDSITQISRNTNAKSKGVRGKSVSKKTAAQIKRTKAPAKKNVAEQKTNWDPTESEEEEEL